MQLQDYVRVVLKRWWMIGLVTVVAVVSAYVFSKLQTPLYRSTTSYSVLINRLDSGANSFIQGTLNTYRNLVYNKDQLQLISNQLKLDRTGEALLEYVQVQPQPDDNRIVIEVEYTDPQSAKNIADAVGRLLNTRVVGASSTLQGEDRLSLLLIEAPQDGVLSQPRTRVNMLAGGVLGLILGVLLAFVLEYVDNTLKTAADVERFTELTTIGQIPSGAAQGGRSRPRLRPAAASGIVAHHENKHDK